MNTQTLLVTSDLAVCSRRKRRAVEEPSMETKRRKVQSRIQNLPNELKATIVAFITDPKTLTNLAYTDKGFYDTIKRDEAKLCATLFNKHIGCEFLGLAVAVAHSRAIQKTPYRGLYGKPRPILDLSDEEIIAFADEHFPRDVSHTIETPDWKMNLKLCVELFSFHEVVDSYVPIIAKSVVLVPISGDDDNRKCCRKSEIGRFRKALYIMQLLGNLFPRGGEKEDASDKREEAYAFAWTHLLTKFAPWELQQVRCAKELLAMHIHNIVRDKSPLHLDMRLLRAFVSNEGLFALKRQEELRGILGPIMIFQALSRNWRRTDVWYNKHDLIWLWKLGRPLILDATETLNQYLESNSAGPKDVWLYTLLSSRVVHPIFNFSTTAFFKNHQTSEFKLTSIFWDRERLDQVFTGKPLPTTVQMLSVGNVLYDPRRFSDTAQFR